MYDEFHARDTHCGPHRLRVYRHRLGRHSRTTIRLDRRISRVVDENRPMSSRRPHASGNTSANEQIWFVVVGIAFLLLALIAYLSR